MKTKWSDPCPYQSLALRLIERAIPAQVIKKEFPTNTPMTCLSLLLLAGFCHSAEMLKTPAKLICRAAIQLPIVRMTLFVRLSFFDILSGTISGMIDSTCREAIFRYSFSTVAKSFFALEERMENTC